ncbi:MAG TPA: hypothetical protein DCS88_00965 [Alphaproteobacteria bacterium]|nr:hypothetical protein [Alphaproteobacteria bacterium]
MKLQKSAGNHGRWILASLGKWSYTVRSLPAPLSPFRRSERGLFCPFTHA